MRDVELGTAPHDETAGHDPDALAEGVKEEPPDDAEILAALRRGEVLPYRLDVFSNHSEDAYEEIEVDSESVFSIEVITVSSGSDEGE